MRKVIAGVFIGVMSIVFYIERSVEVNEVYSMGMHWILYLRGETASTYINGSRGLLFEISSHM